MSEKMMVILGVAAVVAGAFLLQYWTARSEGRSERKAWKETGGWGGALLLYTILDYFMMMD